MKGCTKVAAGLKCYL